MTTLNLQTKDRSRKCGLCGRILGDSSDPLSEDIGGDCWGCIGEIEANGGHLPSLKLVRKEYQQGLRGSWYPDPVVEFERSSSNDMHVLSVICSFCLPLGDPRIGEEVSCRLFSNQIEKADYLNAITDHKGEINLRLDVQSTDKCFFEVRIQGRHWQFPEE